MIKSLFFLLAVLFSTSLISQFQGTAVRTGSEEIIMKINDDVEGSSFLFSDWKNADLLDKDGNVVQNVDLNYDGLRKGFVAKSENAEKCIVLNTYQYAEIVVHDEKVGNRNFVRIVNDGDLDFYEVIYRGDKVSCFKKISSKKKRTDVNSYANVTAMYKITNTKETFVLYKDELIKVKRKVKDIDKIFDENIKKFAKSKNLNVKKDEDLSSLMAAIDKGL